MGRNIKISTGTAMSSSVSGAAKKMFSAGSNAGRSITKALLTTHPLATDTPKARPACMTDWK